MPRTSDPRVLLGFQERFPDLKPVDRETLYDDAGIDIIVCAAIPRDRPAVAIRAMRAGKDVMVDKPGAISANEVDELERASRETGRLYSICFSERLVVRACEIASQLVADGEIGRVIQTVGLGPHRLNRAPSGRIGFSTPGPMAAVGHLLLMRLPGHQANSRNF